MLRPTALTRKLLRDLWHIRGQALAIAGVVGAGVGLFVTMMSTLVSLNLSLETYYDRYRFGDLFASCKRAPLSLGESIGAIPGVASTELRVVAEVTLDLPDTTDPIVGHMVSVPSDRRPALCDLFLRDGRYLEPGRPDEVLVSEKFASLHGLGPGSALAAVINGRRRTLAIVGIALSPEFIYTIRPGEILPDDERFAVVWMERRALGAAFDMEGGFNNLVLSLHRGASVPEVKARVDRLLEPYGGLGAIGRDLQTSHWYLANELMQLESMGTFIPVIFLGVAAFLVNVVLSRIVLVQREQIASLKAIGYGNRAIGLHFVEWGLGIASVGVALGLALGAWLGSAMTRLYTEFFNFPLLVYRIDAATIVEAIAIGLAASAAGAMMAVRRAVSVPPAEAMRPAPPLRFTRSPIERWGLDRLLTQSTRIVVRNLHRKPGRAAVSVVGIALACSLLVVGNFSMDAFDVMMDIQFNVAQRYDAVASFVEPASPRARHEVERLPGVISVEPMRSVPVRFVAGHRSRYGAITGIARGAELNRSVEMDGRVIEPPADGLALSATLARLLGVGAGDTVAAEVLEGSRPRHLIRVNAVVDDLLGSSAYMDIDALRRLNREGAVLSGAYLKVDPAEIDGLNRRLKALPRVAAVVLKDAALRSMLKTMAEMMTEMRAINVLFAVIIAFGVVYNSARISLSERSRELATLRVIGFTRGEISYILLGEFALVTLAAIPLGLIIGYGLAGAMIDSFSTDLFRLPLAVSGRTNAMAAATIAVATAVSALIVRRRLDRLDLVDVLKTRE